MSVRLPLITLLAITGLLLVACGDDDDAQSDPTPTEVEATPTAGEPTPTAEEPTATPEPAATPEPTPTLEPTATPVGVPTPTEDEQVVNVYWLRDTQIAVGGRIVPDSELATKAMEALLAGPNQLEAELDMVTAIPPGTELLGLTVSDREATVDLSGDVEATGLGTSGEIGLVAQIVFTLTQFADVDRVTITIEGESRDAILSHGLEANDLTREAFFDAVSPEIVVESPYPGQLVTSPLTVTGFSRTFEATVVYVVTVPPSGEIAAEGFTTARQPDVQLFGPFEFVAEFEPDVAGFGAVIVFEESAEDGSQINVYEVPVLMDPAAG